MKNREILEKYALKFFQKISDIGVSLDGKSYVVILDRGTLINLYFNENVAGSICVDYYKNSDSFLNKEDPYLKDASEFSARYKIKE
jgi:hypothetical protein